MKSFFVSSTFNDMHDERDLIQEKIMPMINAEAQKVGDAVSFCDLRWGVNTMDMDSNEGSAKVLRVCFDEIDKCRPYMIVFIGARYGWIPDTKLIEDCLEDKELYLDDLEKSVTELEIEYGAFKTQEGLSNVLFYFREIEGEAPDKYLIEDEKCAEKLSHLKQRIFDLTKGRVKKYTVLWDNQKKEFIGYEKLEEMIVSDLKALLEPEWKRFGEMSLSEREIYKHMNLLSQNTFEYFKKDFFNKCISEIERENVLVIKGESGCGKTVFMSQLATEFISKGMNVLPVYCGETAGSSDAVDVTKIIISFFEKVLNKQVLSEPKNHKTSHEYRERMLELQSEYADESNDKIIIFIDGLEQLFPDINRENLLFLPSHINENIHYILSCDSRYHIKYPFSVFDMPKYDNSDVINIIKGQLNREHRELDLNVLNAIEKKVLFRKVIPFNESVELNNTIYQCTETISRPLYAYLILRRLLMMRKIDFNYILEKGGNMQAISQYQLKVLNEFPQNMDEAIMDIIEAAVERVGDNSVKKMLSFIANSRYGLRTKEINKLMTLYNENWCDLNFYAFTNYLKDFFMFRDDGRVDFTNSIIKQSILSQIDDSDFDVNEKLFMLFSSLGEDDKVIKEQEIAYYSLKNDRKQFFLDYIDKEENNDGNLKVIAKDLWMTSRSDDVSWIKQLLFCCYNSESEIERTISFLDFLVKDINGVISSNDDELKLKIIIFEEGLKVAEKINNKYDSIKLTKIALDFKILLADTYNNFYDKEKRGKCSDYYLDAIEYYIDLIESGTPDDSDFRKYFDVLLKYGILKINDFDLSINSQIDGSEALRKAYDDLDKWESGDINEKKNIKVDIYLNWAMAGYMATTTSRYFKKSILKNKKMIKEALTDAYEDAEEAFTLLNELMDSGGLRPESKYKLACAKRLQGNILEASYSKVNHREALLKYKDAYEICEKLNMPWNNDMVNIEADSCSAILDHILEYNEWKTLDEALLYSEKNVELRKIICEDKQLTTDIRTYIGALHKKLLILLGMKRTDDYEEITSLLNETSFYLEKIKDEMGDTGVQMIFAENLFLKSLQESYTEGKIINLNGVMEARAMFPKVVNTFIKFINRAWKKY